MLCIGCKTELSYKNIATIGLRKYSLFLHLLAVDTWVQLQICQFSDEKFEWPRCKRQATQSNLYALLVACISAILDQGRLYLLLCQGVKC